MLCALAAVGFLNDDISYNRKIIEDTLRVCSGKADLVLFGEAFLQGFYAATFEEAHDETIALSVEDDTITFLRAAAKAHNIAVSFGFIEKDGNCFYSSQMTIGKDGEILDLFRRVSKGWKLPHASGRYREGEGFHTFCYMDKTLAVGLCGDLWDDENVRKMRALSPDAILWPVYTDFAADAWNTEIKHEYAQQAECFGAKALYVNPYCVDKQQEEDIAKGGAALFENGSITAETPAGKASLLFVNI